MENTVFAQDFVEFLNDASTAFHAVSASRKIYIQSGFIELNEGNEWSLEPGGKYFFVRNATTILAFVIGKKYQSGNGFTCLGAHTDSPCFKIKPVSCSTKSEVLVLNTQPYGGGLWHTWFDRDLGIAGRIIVKGNDGLISSHLVDIRKPVARIPTLAIHLSDAKERDAFSPNLQENAKAFLTTNLDLFKHSPEQGESSKRIHPCLAGLLAQASGVDPANILDFELQLTDIQPPCLGGATGEFIFSGRLDNLCSAYQCVRALAASASETAVNEQTTVTMAMLFDHEEVGSSSAQGAGSNLFMDSIRRILASLGDDSTSTQLRTLRKSFVVSADMAHALHPNYPSKHDPTLAPRLNGGLVIKNNANQRYATSAVSATMFREFAALAKVPVQEFAVRSDGGCGSTIGPILSTLSGIHTVDCGTPQLSMHSAREMMGSQDAYTGYLHLRSALENHAAVSSRMTF